MRIDKNFVYVGVGGIPHVLKQEITRIMDHDSIIKQCVFIDVGPENVTMGWHDLVQGGANEVSIGTRFWFKPREQTHNAS